MVKKIKVVNRSERDIERWRRRRSKCTEGGNAGDRASSVDLYLDLLLLSTEHAQKEVEPYEHRARSCSFLAKVSFVFDIN